MILAAARPGAEGAEGLAGDRDDAPAVRAEFLHGRVADAAAGAGQHQRPHIVAQGGRVHESDPTPADRGRHP